MILPPEETQSQYNIQRWIKPKCSNIKLYGKIDHKTRLYSSRSEQTSSKKKKKKKLAAAFAITQFRSCSTTYTAEGLKSVDSYLK